MMKEQKSAVHFIAKGLVDVMFYGGIVCVLAVPWLAKWLDAWFNEGHHPHYYAIVIPILFLSGILAVTILYCLKKMYRTLLGGNPFVEENIQCFRKMAAACGGIAVIYFVKCFLLFSPATVIVMLVFVVGMLFCLTLKDIFQQAICYKEENDLTI